MISHCLQPPVTTSSGGGGGCRGRRYSPGCQPTSRPERRRRGGAGGYLPFHGAGRCHMTTDHQQPTARPRSRPDPARSGRVRAALAGLSLHRVIRASPLQTCRSESPPAWPPRIGARAANGNSEDNTFYNGPVRDSHLMVASVGRNRWPPPHWSLESHHGRRGEFNFRNPVHARAGAAFQPRDRRHHAPPARRQRAAHTHEAPAPARDLARSHPPGVHLYLLTELREAAAAAGRAQWPSSSAHGHVTG